MWIRKRKSNNDIRYQYNQYVTDRTGKRVTVSVTLNSNSRQARNKAMALLQVKADEITKTPAEKRAEKLQQLTFYNVIDEWHEYTAPMIKPATRENHQNYINRIKKAIPPTMLFIEFTPNIADKIVHNMYYIERLSFSYSSATLITIKNVFRYAKKQGYIDNIFELEDLKLKKRPITEKELHDISNKFLNRDELHECLQQLNKIDHRLSLLCEFLALTGLRCGELLALRVQDYTPEKPSININGTIVKNTKNGDDVQRGTPKNKYSYRDVYLSERAKKIIDYFILDNKKMAQWNRKIYKDRGFIFTTSTGYPYNLQFINSKLRQVKIKDKHISSHIFRHTHISLLAEMNTPQKAVMQRVGHNDPTTTNKIYTHVTSAMSQQLKNNLDKMVI